MATRKFIQNARYPFCMALPESESFLQNLFTFWKSVVDEGRPRDMLYRFSVVIEKAEGNYSAYSPDLPGCIAVGDTLEEIRQNMEEAICIHIEGMIEDHEPLFPGQTFALLRKLFHAILRKNVKHI